MVHRTDTSTVSTVHTNALYKGKAAEGPSGTLGDHKVTLGKGDFPPATDTRAGNASKGFFASIANWFKDAFANLRARIGSRETAAPATPAAPAQAAAKPLALSTDHTHTPGPDRNVSNGDKQTIVFNNVSYEVTRDYDQDKQHVRDYAKGIVANQKDGFKETTFMRSNEPKVPLRNGDGDPLVVTTLSPTGKTQTFSVYTDVDKRTSPIFNHYATALTDEIDTFAAGVGDSPSVITENQASKAGPNNTVVRAITDDQARTAANKAVADFDALMITLFGGTDTQSIDDAVAAAPPRLRELISVAHAEIQKEGDALKMSQADIDKMKTTSTVNFVALRTINPAIGQAVNRANGDTVTDKGVSLKNVSKLVQNVFNGVDPIASKKEPVTPEFREAFGTRFNDWSQAMASYMEKLPA